MLNAQASFMTEAFGVTFKERLQLAHFYQEAFPPSEFRSNLQEAAHKLHEGGRIHHILRPTPASPQTSTEHGSHAFLGAMTVLPVRLAIPPKTYQLQVIEYFAISDRARGAGLGQKWLSLIEADLKTASEALLVEVEPLSLGVDAARRQHFYQRLGFTKLLVPYAMPHFACPGEKLAMELMVYPSSLVQSPAFDPDLLAQTVYEALYTGKTEDMES